MTHDLRAELTLHSAVNERGVAVDRAFAESLHATWIAMKLDARDEIALATGGKLTREKASSGPAVHAWLRSVGVKVASLRKDFIATILDDPDALGAGDDETAALVSHVLRLRADVVRAGEGKVARLVGTLDADDRLRRMLVYHGAGPGRWSSRVVQVQNLPKGVKGVDVEELCSGLLTAERVRRAAQDAEQEPSDVLATLVRPCFVAPAGRVLCIADFASVEARGVAWMSGETSLLSTFAAGGDVYCEMASSLYGRVITKADAVERQLGKTLILGAMYGLGAGGFVRACKKEGVDLEVAGAPYRDEYDREKPKDWRGEPVSFEFWFAKRCIDGYRKRYPAIPKLWKTLIDAMFDAVRSGSVHRVGHCTIAMKGLNLVTTLPSGREIVYRDARISRRVPRWAVLQGRLDVPESDCLDYTHPHGQRELWHGTATENCSQAICRDLLVTAMIELYRMGHEIVLHVHDEIVTEADDHTALDEVCRVMSTPPTWAEGFPVEVSGFTGPRYVKSPFRDAYEAHYRGGVRCSK